MDGMTEAFQSEVHLELERDILPFWLGLKDPSGGFYGEVLSDGTVMKDAPRGEILNARIIWSFAAAYRYLPRPEYLSAALHARDWFVSFLLDPEFGGVYWSAASDGTPLDTKKQLYSQAFAIYAFSELYKVTSSDEDLAVATGLFRIVEECFADSVFGGYAEALSRDFTPLEDMSLSAHDINADKTMNSHLHLLEAYANLYQVWPDPSLKKALTDLIHLMCERITGTDGHLRLYFNPDWTVIPGAVSYGHDIETSWLLLECAQATRNPSVVEYVMPYCRALGMAGNEGLLPDGSMAYELFPEGELGGGALPEGAADHHSGGVLDLSRQWWVQAETVVGNLRLWKYHSDPEGLPRAFRCWDWIKEHLIASPCHSEHCEESCDGHKLYGEWYWGTLADGLTPDLASPKAGFWKCPYHNTRMCLEVLKILDLR